MTADTRPQTEEYVRLKDRTAPDGSIKIPAMGAIEGNRDEDRAHFTDRATIAILDDQSGAPAVSWTENGIVYWITREFPETRFTPEALDARISATENQMAALQRDLVRLQVIRRHRTPSSE